MELRNIRRVYLAGKGLRVWRKKYAGNVLSAIGLKYLFCLYYHGGYLAADTLRDVLSRDGNSTNGVAVVYNVLAGLVAGGYVERVEDIRGRVVYGLSVLGLSSLYDIEKCIRAARPDR